MPSNVLDQRRAGITLAKLDDAARRVLCIDGFGVTLEDLWVRHYFS